MPGLALPNRGLWLPGAKPIGRRLSDLVANSFSFRWPGADRSGHSCTNTCCGTSSPPPCIWACVTDSACFSTPVDVRLCPTDATHYSGTNSAAGVSVALNYDPSSGSTFTYSGTGCGHTHNFAAGATLPFSYSDPGGWAIGASSTAPVCGNSKTCAPCAAGSANEYLVELSANFSAATTCPNDSQGNPVAMVCNSGTCSAWNSADFTYHTLSYPGLDGAYYCAFSSSSPCEYLVARSATYFVYGCCAYSNIHTVIAEVFFLSDMSGYHVEVRLKDGGGVTNIGIWRLTQSTPFDCFSFDSTSIPWVSQDSATLCDSSAVTCKLTTV